MFHHPGTVRPGRRWCFVNMYQTVLYLQNIPPERGAEFFLGDVSSVAAVKPLKPSTFAALTFLWKQLRSHAGHSTGILGITDAIVMQRVRERESLCCVLNVFRLDATD
jgi:hypothetical protein